MKAEDAMNISTCYSIILCLVALPSLTRRVKAEPEKPKIPLAWYLASEAQAVDCRFTLEYARPKSVPLSDFEKVIVPDVTDDAKSIDQVVRNLTDVLLGVVVWVDKDNPKLIHLMDNRLTKLPDYVMNKVGKVRYNGALFSLPYGIGSALGISLTSPEGAGYTDLALTDMVTQVKVSTATESVRSMLSNHVPKKPQCSILWVSTTVLTPKVKTEVTFYR